MTFLPLFFKTCLHNTEGDKCSRCQRGFYGDASGGTGAGDCATCKCPMDVPEANAGT